MIIGDCFLSLKKEALPNWININLGRPLGHGAQGSVFKFGNNNKVIKIATTQGFHVSISEVKKVLESLIIKPHPHMVRIHSYGIIDKKKGLYFYIAEKLKRLNVIEHRFVNNIVSYDGSSYIKPNIKMSKKIKNLNCTIKELCDSADLKNRRFIIDDIHGHNIMKNKFDIYKMADVGLVRLKRKWLDKITSSRGEIT